MVRVFENAAPGEVHNIGSGEERYNLEVARRIAKALDASEDLIEFIEDRPGYNQRYAFDASKLANIGQEPQWSFEDGLCHTIGCYL